MVLSDEERRRKARERIRIRRSDPNYQKKQSERRRQKIANDKAYAENKRKKDRERIRKKRKENPEYYKQIYSKYKKRHPERVKKSAAQNYLKNRKARLEYRKKRYTEKHDEILSLKRQRYSTDSKYNLKVKIQKKDSLKRIKKEVMIHYSKNVVKCKFCETKELEFLTIDHILGRKSMGHDHSYGSSKLYRWIKNNDYPRGFRVLCWNCNQLEYLKIKNKNLSKTKVAKYTRDIRKKLRFDIYAHYSKGIPKCKCCGFDNIDLLSIDHILGRKIVGHKSNLTSHRLYNWLKKNNFPKGYQVLCRNCNSAKSNKGKCPHQRK